VKLAVVAFTETGVKLGKKIASEFSAQGDSCTVSAPSSIAGACGAADIGDFSRWTKQAFSDADGLIFVGASGIAVRAIAPYLKDKFTDPAVVSVDELGQFAVSLLSGHVGGANKLADKVAMAVGGIAVISTATDVQGCFSVDTWAVKQGLSIAGKTAAKRISAALLSGKPVYLRSDFPIEGKLPEGIFWADSGELGIYITTREDIRPFDKTLLLHPKNTILGIGCRRGVSAQTISEVVFDVLKVAGISALSLKCAATIDLKADEQGLIEFCVGQGIAMHIYSAEELLNAKGEFTPSAFVSSVTGVDNICERAAVCARGELIIKKQARNGVTTAIALASVSLSFSEEEE